MVGGLVELWGLESFRPIAHTSTVRSDCLSADSDRAYRKVYFVDTVLSDFSQITSGRFSMETSVKAEHLRIHTV